ncbi:MAG: hypothetical protein RB296_01425 [Acidobacteriota bacterium]|jgi:hypothetical protein|nr:hypothetical protein [Acidobacteriota bacterium]
MKKRDRKHAGALLPLMFMALTLFQARALTAMEFGAYAGALNKAGTTLVGLTLDSGFLFPMLKLETEAYMFTRSERTGKVLTLGLKINPAFGRVSPYAAAGVGTEVQRFDLSQAKDRYFTFIGGGIKIRLAPMLFLRLDLRFQQHGKKDESIPGTEKVNYFRYTAGLVIRI